MVTAINVVWIDEHSVRNQIPKCDRWASMSSDWRLRPLITQKPQFTKTSTHPWWLWDLRNARGSKYVSQRLSFWTKRDCIKAPSSARLGVIKQSADTSIRISHMTLVYHIHSSEKWPLPCKSIRQSKFLSALPWWCMPRARGELPSFTHAQICTILWCTIIELLQCSENFKFIDYSLSASKAKNIFTM